MSKSSWSASILAMLIIILLSSCTSQTANPESNQEAANEVQTAPQNDASPGLPRDDNQSQPDVSSKSPPSESAGGSGVSEQPAPVETSEPSGNTQSAESKPGRIEPTPLPTTESDVIPFASAEEESRMVTLQIDKQYGPGTMINSGELGIAFTVPAGWIGTVPQGSSAFVMGSETRPGLILITSQDSNSTEEVVRTLSQRMPLDEGVYLEPSGQAETDGTWVENSATATDGIDVFNGYVMALVRRSGVGIFIAAIGPYDTDYYKGLASQIASSTRATKTTVASDRSSSANVGGKDSTALAKEWTDFLAGMRATYLSSYSSGSSGGFSDKTEYDFCSDGQFAQSGSSSLSIDTGGASAFSGGSSGGSGQWKILTQGDQVFLQLDWSDGSFGQPLLEYIDSKTYIGGERYFITPDNTTCR